MTKTPWVATTQNCDAVGDLNDVARGDGFLFVKNGVGHAGRGEVFRGTAEEVLQFLRVITRTAKPGAKADVAPIAFGLIPFLSTEATEFIVPEICVTKDDLGHCSVSVITPPDVDDSNRESRVQELIDSVVSPVNRPQPSSSSFTVEPITPIPIYLQAVERARDAVRDGELEKVVIARDVRVSSPEPIDVHAVLLRLKASFGSSYRYSVSGLVGASPELLVQVSDGVVHSNPLAGTTMRTGDPQTDAALATELLASAKNQIEHRVVVNMVHDTLLKWCSYLDWEPEPSVVAVANVQHLGTHVTGPLSRSDTHVYDIARDLCPTPALGGYPRDEAILLIDDIEGMRRGRYGGAVGWCDASGNGTFAVTIRCAEFSANKKEARLFAGGGIVADSEPLSELAETQAKLQAMLSAIIRS